MIQFVVKIAEVNILIVGFYPETTHYFKDFLSDEPAVEQITVKEKNIKEYKEKYPQFNERQCERAFVKYRMDSILVGYNAFPVHASALAYNDKAFLFTALSGVGKSTHSRRWREAFGDMVTMINDDRPYLKVKNGSVYVYSHPQAGKHGIYTNTHFPVLVIGKLIRDKNNYVKKIPEYQAFPYLAQQSFTMDTPQLTGKILKLIRKIVQIVEFYEIHCNLDADSGLEIYNQLMNATNKKAN